MYIKLVNGKYFLYKSKRYGKKIKTIYLGKVKIDNKLIKELKGGKILDVELRKCQK